jgi:hypothetical protein
MTIRLFVDDSEDENGRLHAQFDAALSLNLQNPAIGQVIIIGRTEIKQLNQFESSRVRWVKLLDGERPDLARFQSEANQRVTSPNDISIITSAACYFDQTLTDLIQLNLDGVCLALSGQNALKSAGFEQPLSRKLYSTWIFQGRIRPLLNASIELDAEGSDRRVIWELKQAGYFVCDPSPSFTCGLLGDTPPKSADRSLAGPICDKIPAGMIEQLGLAADRGIPAGVIAFSLFGNERRYCQGAVENAKLIQWIYPGWTARFYVDESIPQAVLKQLHSQHAEIVVMPLSWDQEGIFWRFLVADEPGYQCWLVRDADSRLNYRERRAVDDWLDSGREFHVMRDHPAHCKPIMGAMFGGLRGALPNMALLIDDWRTASRPYGRHGDDETFLAEIIWPLVQDRSLIHDSNLNRHGQLIRDFPTSYENFRFVGERIYADSHCHQLDRERLIQARLKQHRLKSLNDVASTGIIE